MIAGAVARATLDVRCPTAASLYFTTDLDEAEGAHVALQNAGVSFVPLTIWNRDSFLRPLIDMGYELIDEWSIPELPCSIPFHPERSFPALTGLYLRARGA